MKAGLTMSEVSPYLQLLRGPVLIGAVVSTVALPYLFQLSNATLFKVAIFCLGIALFCKDLLSVTETKLRGFLARKIDGIILDDFLRSIYDPETGWIASIVGTSVGNATMYALPMDSEQRTKLMQATLWVDQTQARTILSEPGGCRYLFPESFQKWLRAKAENFEGDDEAETSLFSTATGNQNSNHLNSLAKPVSNFNQPSLGIASKPRLDADEFVIREVDTASTSVGSQQTEEDALKEKFDYSSSNVPRNIQGERQRNLNIEEENLEDVENDNTRQSYSRFEENPTDPMKVMLQILWDMISDRLKLFAQKIPESTIETVGLTAAAGLALHMGYRKNARVAVTSAMEGIFALGLSSAAAGAVATIFTRHIMMGTIRDAESMKLVSTAMLQRVWQRIKGRWKTMALLLILGAFKKSRQSRRR